MAKPKSFLKNISIDICLKKHKCQHNPKHEILKGDKRLRLKVDRTQEYFCVDCALKTLQRDIDLLQEIKMQLTDDID